MTEPWGGLDRGWALLARRPDTAAALVRWRPSEPALPDSIAELAKRLRSHDLAVADPAYGALLRVAPGDPTAGWVALYGMVPRLRAAVSGRYRRHGPAQRPGAPSDLAGELVGHLWELLTTSPGRWSHHVGDELVRNALRRHDAAHRHRRHEEPRPLLPRPSRCAPSTPPRTKSHCSSAR